MSLQESSQSSDETNSRSSGDYTPRSRSPQSSDTSAPSPNVTRYEEVCQPQHIALEDLTTGVNGAIERGFPNKNRSRYINVSVLLMRWEAEDPNLPVVREVEELRKTFEDIFHFDVEVFQIPEKQSHLKVSQMINDFVLHNGDSQEDLKIFYYAGHGEATTCKDLLFSSYRRETSSPRTATVTWSGIQNTLEQAASDVLILLDCCSAGTCHLGNGNGVTELIAACPPDSQANAGRGIFTVAELYASIYSRMLSHMAQGLRGERYPSPIHLFLTEDKRFPRSIMLSVRAKSMANSEPLKDIGVQESGSQPAAAEPAAAMAESISLRQNLGGGSPTQPANRECRSEDDARRQDARTILIAVRLDETMAIGHPSVDAISEWLRRIPVLAEKVECFPLEGLFLCDSTLIILRVPIPVWVCLPDHPAIITLGSVRSSNLLLTENTQTVAPGNEVVPKFESIQGKKVSFADDIESIRKSGVPGSCSNEWEDSPSPDLRITLDVPLEEFLPSKEGTHFIISGPAMAYIRNISDKYPLADRELVERLGQANWERHVRIRKTQNSVSEGQNDVVQIVEPSVFKSASFRDSALGSSLPTIISSAPSVATSFASRADDSDICHFRVPPMPAASSEDAGFACPYCGYLLHITSRRDWKRHVFADIEPYICTFSQCRSALCTFRSRAEWALHEAQHHFLPTHWPCTSCDKVMDESSSLFQHWLLHSPRPEHLGDEERIEHAALTAVCRICGQTPGTLKSYISHVAKHMESIALAALPDNAEDSDDEILSENLSIGGIENELAKAPGNTVPSEAVHLRPPPVQTRGKSPERTALQRRSTNNSETSSPRSKPPAAIGGTTSYPDIIDPTLPFSISALPSSDIMDTTAMDPGSSKDSQAVHELAVQQSGADLERHSGQVHPAEQDKVKYFCDYKNCIKKHVAFHRKDQCQEHFRDFHKEDVLLQGKPITKEWFQNRNIIPEWWRCSQCLKRIEVAASSYECPSCRVECEPDRQRLRRITYESQKA